MRDDRLLEIRVFKAVAEHGSFTAAAVALSVTQPFVSRIVTQLEERFNVSLLRRTTRRISLTMEGKRFLELSITLLDHLEKMEASLSSDLQGEIKLTAPTSFGMEEIIPLVPRFVQRYPLVQVNLSMTDVPVDILEGGYDLAVRMGQLPDSSLLCKKLAPLQRIVVAAPAYLKRHGEPAHPNELKNHNCLLWDSVLEHLNYWPFDIDGRKVKLRISGNFRSITGVSIGQLCFAGFGIARMAEHLALPAISRGTVVPILRSFQPIDDTGIYAVYPSDRFIHPRVRAFIDFLAESFASPPWEKPDTPNLLRV